MVDFNVPPKPPENDDETNIDEVVMQYVQQFGIKHTNLILAALARWNAPPSHDIVSGFKYGMWFALREITEGRLKIAIVQIDNPDPEKEE